MKHRHLAAVVLLPFLLGATDPECSGTGSTVSTINEDDGEHTFHTWGRFKFDKTLSPHGAGIACQWDIKAQSDREKTPHPVDSGTETEKIYISKPTDETTKVWLTSTSCGKWK
jgi:hypothetical protein